MYAYVQEHPILRKMRTVKNGKNYEILRLYLCDPMEKILEKYIG